jgi:hypothetical protein
MNDDWRLRVHLPDGGRGRMLAESLEAMTLEHELQEALPERVAVSHDEDDVFVYAGTREDTDRARALVSKLAAHRGWPIEVQLDRWHPVAEQWEDPDRPLPTGSDELAQEHAELIQEERQESREQGYPQFEVRVECRSRADALQLQERLHGEGIPSLRRWNYLLVGAPDEDTAAGLAQRIGSESPAGSVVSTEATGRAADALRPSNPFAVFGGLGG